MLPFKTNIKIFIIEFVCAMILFAAYAITEQGVQIAPYFSLGLLPALFMALIGVKVQNELTVIRCLYMASIFTFTFVCYVIGIQETLPFMLLTVGVTIALFVHPRVYIEYFIITTIELIITGILSDRTDLSLYVTYVMMYEFASAALISIIVGVERYKQDMEEKNEEAQEALNAKSNFLANMSHEIRTPMNAIYGMAELLEERDFGKEEREYIATIKNSSESLLSIINEILDFSKVDSGKMTVVNEPYNVNNTLQDVISIIRFRLRDKNVVLQTNIDKQIPIELNGDEIRVRQILINILNNAVKFTNKGSITLDMQWEYTGQNEGMLRIQVVDTGIGISEENIEKLFTAFGQLDTKKNRNVEGTGLGLAICKELVDIMGGSIGVSSVIKEGSTFFVNIPQKVYDATPCNYEDGGDDLYNLDKEVTIPFIAPRAKVLIVDDNSVNRQVAKELMKLYGFEAALAESGQEVIDRVERNLVSYDIIFMDHMMPFMDGVEATKHIRNLNSGYAKHVPIVALTANAITGVEKQFMDAGMNDYISKPIRIDQLSEILGRWIPKSKQYPRTMTIEEIEARESRIDYSQMSKEEILEHLDGVDIRSGIKNCAGSIDMYFEILRTFSQSNLINVLNTYYESEDLENYGVTAHSVKGACKNIGAHDLADKAYSLERAGKRADINYIWDNHQEFIEDYNKLLTLLKRIFYGNIINR